MRITFRFDWNTSLDGQQMDAVADLVGRRLKLKEDGSLDTFQDYHADLRQLLRVVPPECIELQGAGAHGLADLVEEIERLGAKVDAIAPVFNEKVQVSVPGFALMEIREIRVAYDACTDSIQTDLDHGWRILAICPQPDQRRPDYIMGRTERSAD